MQLAYGLHYVYTKYKRAVQEVTMQFSIKKWGNSQGIIISKEVMELLNAQVGDALDASFEDGNLVLKKKRKHKTLEERIEESGVPLSFGEEIDWGESRGTELW